MPPHNLHLTTTTPPISNSINKPHSTNPSTHFPIKPLKALNLIKPLKKKPINQSYSTNPSTHFPINPPKPLKEINLIKPLNKKPLNKIPISDFQEKMLFLDSVGLDLFALVSLHPPLISVPASEVKSLVSFLHSAASLSSKDVRRVVTMCPDVLSMKMSSVVPVITFLLREAGVSGAGLRHVIHRRPRLLCCDVKTRLRPSLYFLQGNIGVTDVSKYTYLLSCSVENKFLPRIECFRKMGLGKSDVRAVFRRFPPLFCYGVEGNLEVKFEYFRVEMGRGLKEIVEFPQYFSFSLENRIKPRHRKCVEKGVSLSLPMMLKSSDRRFLDRLEVCCDSSMPVRTSPLWDINYDYDYDYDGVL